MLKNLLWLVAAVVIAAMLAAGLRAYGTALVGSGYSAEILCGAVFVSGREPEAVEAEDLTGPGFELLRYFDKQVERTGKRVTASFHGLAAQTAVYRDGFGCTRIDGDKAGAAALPHLAPPPPADPEALWPEGERVDLDAPGEGIDRAALDAALAAAFAEPDPAAAFQAQEIRRLLWVAVDRLDERDRQVLRLYYLEDRTLAEIGRMLGVTESRVSQLHSRLVARLRTRLDELAR